MNQEINNKISNEEYDVLISDSIKNSSAKEKSITIGKIISIESFKCTTNSRLQRNIRIPKW